MPPHNVPARGITSQPSVSMSLLRADTIAAGSEIWAEDEGDGGEDVWMLAEVVRQENTLLTVRKKETGEELEIDLVGSVCPRLFGFSFCGSTHFAAILCAMATSMLPSPCGFDGHILTAGLLLRFTLPRVFPQLPGVRVAEETGQCTVHTNICIISRLSFN